MGAPGASLPPVSFLALLAPSLREAFPDLRLLLPPAESGEESRLEACSPHAKAPFAELKVVRQSQAHTQDELKGPREKNRAQRLSKLGMVLFQNHTIEQWQWQRDHGSARLS